SPDHTAAAAKLEHQVQRAAGAREGLCIVGGSTTRVTQRDRDGAWAGNGLERAEDVVGDRPTVAVAAAPVRCQGDDRSCVEHGQTAWRPLRERVPDDGNE